MTTVATTDLLRVRAALSVGAPPAEAFAAVTDPTLADAVHAVRLGRPLAAVARAAVDADTMAHAGPLLRALAVVERCGQGGVAAIDMALQAHQDAIADEQRMLAKTAQAAGTAKLLTVLPVAAWLLMVTLDRAARAFYATPLGWACAGATALLAAAGHRWARRLVTAAAGAAKTADPLARTAEPFDSTTLEAELSALVERLGVKAKDVYQPLRVAITGTTVSPGIFESLAVLVLCASGIVGLIAVAHN